MLELMREHKDQLGLPTASSDAAWDETISNTKVSLRNASQLNITNWQVIADTLYLNLEVKNKTGHKLPSGYPSRLGWLQVVLTSPITGDTLYANGVMDADGHIAGRDFPYEPHHEVSYSDQDVQIYELVMQDMHGQLTTRLNGAASPFKDNRLLPLGFRTTHSTYDTVAIWGNAATDEDYATNSQQGADHIEYRIPVPEGVMTGDLHLSFRYQSLPARWMNDLFSHDSIQEVNRFKTMYAAYKRFDEVMDSIVLENIDLDISASHFPSMLTQIQLYPNPVMHDQLFFHDASLEKIPGDARYEIYASNGTLVQQGTLTREIRLSAGIRPGLYYITILSKNRRIATQNFTVL